jgi:hypothetical protein
LNENCNPCLEGFSAAANQVEYYTVWKPQMCPGNVFEKSHISTLKALKQHTTTSVMNNSYTAHFFVGPSGIRALKF